MRGLTRLASAPGRPTAACSAVFSTFSGAGGGGRGRGRGTSPPPTPSARVPGQPEPDSGDDPFSPSPGLGHGRGGGHHSVLPSSPALPSFSSFMSALKPPSSPAAGRGRGRAQSPPPPPAESAGRGVAPPGESTDSAPKKPVFFRRENFAGSAEQTHFADPDEAAPLPRSLSPLLSGSGRGKHTQPAERDPKAGEENRHLRPRGPIGAPRRGLEPPSEQRTSQPRMTREDAVRKAVEVLSRGGRGGGRGRGGRAVMGGRGRGGRFRGGRAADDSEEYNLYLGDNADGERLEKKLGEEKIKMIAEEFEHMMHGPLPSLIDNAYRDAVHTNNMIEYEPEYLVDFDNPDIDEKPPMSLTEALEKSKPFLMAYEGMQSQEEWEEAVKDIMENLPHMKELIDMYCGPDRVTAKQQQQELERVAKTLPENIPSSVKAFTNRAVLSLQSNPGWGWDKKCQFMDKLVWEVSQHYK